MKPTTITAALFIVICILLVLLWFANKENVAAAKRDRQILLKELAAVQHERDSIKKDNALRADTIQLERQIYANQNAWNEKRHREDVQKITAYRSRKFTPAKNNEERDSVTAAIYHTLKDSARTYAVAPLVFDSLTFETTKGRECTLLTDHLETSLDSARSQLATGSALIETQGRQIRGKDRENQALTKELATTKAIDRLERKRLRRQNTRLKLGLAGTLGIIALLIL